jgi:hyperosmotically inducible periplasmic protein
MECTMKRTLPIAALIAATALAATGCDKAKTSTAYNNSGTSATPSQPAGSVPMTSGNDEARAQPAPGAANGATPSALTPDTASPNVASTTASADNTGNANGSATGAISETVTTGKIKAAIAADSAMKDADISVTTKDGVVSLGGTVKSQDQVAIATNLAQRQEGVQRVESNIQVR